MPYRSLMPLQQKIKHWSWKCRPCSIRCARNFSLLALHSQTLYQLANARQPKPHAAPEALPQQPGCSHDADKKSTAYSYPVLSPGLRSSSARGLSDGYVPWRQVDHDQNDTTIRPALSSPHMQPIRALDDQILALRSEVDAFQSERKLLAKYFANNQQVRR